MKLSINLASRRHVNQKSLNLIFSVVILLLLCVLLLQGTAYLKDRQLAMTYQAHLDALQGQLQGHLPERLDPKAIAERRKAYEQAQTLLQRDAFRWTALFDRVESLLPKGVSLRSFQPDYVKNSLMINGVARDLGRLQELLDHLQMENFQQVYLQNQGEVDVDDGRGGKKTALSFSISLAGVF